jgi:hypothetical protein
MRPPWITVPSNAPGVQPSLRGRLAVDGRFGRCVGCSEVKVFCGGCASVAAKCAPCAGSRRRLKHRVANRAYSRSPLGRASGRRRQASFRGRQQANVTDAISTQESTSSTTSVLPTSVTEAARPEVLSPHESSIPSVKTSVDVLRCARCRRVLSGRVRPSERSPERQRPRAPRLPRAP